MKNWVFIISLLSSCIVGLEAQNTSTFTIAGTHTYAIPANAINITVECWGAGGAGGGNNSNYGAGGGGGGGGYIRVGGSGNSLSSFAGKTLNITVGTGGVPSNASGKGGNSIVTYTGGIITITANGGNGGTWGRYGTGGTGGSYSVVGATAVVNYTGGSGNRGHIGSTRNYGGGGGGSAGTESDGNSATGTAYYRGATAVTGGGSGANGGQASFYSPRNGNTPNDTPGGGGGGAAEVSSSSSATGGAGAAGQVRISYSLDTDGDGMPDELDWDSDNDGIFNIDELGSCNTSGSVLDWNTQYTAGSSYSAGDDPVVIKPNLTINGVTIKLSRTISAGIQNGYYRINDNIANDSYTWRHESSNRNYVLSNVFEFNKPVYNLGFILYDVDQAIYSGSTYYFRDKVEIIITKIDGTFHTLSATEYTLGTQSKSSTGNIFWGNGTYDDNSNMTINGIKAWIRKIEIRYSNDAASIYTSGLQAVSMGDISFCNTYRDIDSDGIPDYLDWDSDNDGCPDAIEGDENVISSQLNPNGSINIGATGGVNVNGVPNLVNSGGVADIGGDQGQGVGTSNSHSPNTLCNNKWVGNSVPTSWATNANWTANTPPYSGENVVFATAGNNGGVAATSNLVIDQNRIIGNLDNGSDKSLIIPANKSLTVTGTVTGSSTLADAGKLQIQAAAGQPNGTFILDCTNQGATDVYGTVQFYAKGFKDNLPDSTWVDDITGSPTNGTTFKARYHWQHFGVPVESIVANPTFHGSFLRMYDESYNGDNSRYFQKWRTLNNSSVLQAFKGYEITQDVATTYTIQGKLQYCDKTITLTRSAVPVTGASGDLNNIRYGLGQNIFGNSFTASIDIETLVFPEKVEPTVYLYNTGRFTDWGNDGALNSGTLSAGQYTSIPQNVASIVYDDKIPSMNGFLLIHRGPTPYYSTTSDASVTMTLPYATGIKPNSRPQTAPREPLSYLRVQLQSESTIDNLWLFSKDDATDKIDDGWDGRKFFGTPKAFIFTENKDGAMQINVDKTIDGSLISFYANQDKEYSLTLVKSNLEQYDQLHLIDYYEHKMIPLTSDTTIYHFISNNKGNVENRFRIVNSSNIHLNSDEMKMLDGHLKNNNMLVLYNFTTKNGIANLYDTAGKTIISKTLQLSINEIPVNLQRGIYILSMEADGKRESVKVVVH